MTTTTTTVTGSAPPFSPTAIKTTEASLEQVASQQQQPNGYAFDPVALTKKYNEEREKRVRGENALSQYKMVMPGDELSHLLNDPSVEQRLEREVVKEECEVVVVGGGYGAQLVAVELLKNGIRDVRIIEKGSDFGGTWFWNRYPGAQCDIESYVYMPLLEEMDYVPTQKYAGHEELFEHSRAIGRKYGLYDKALFQTEVQELRWQEDQARWAVTTDRGDIISARFVVPAAGPLHRPKLPDLPGLSSFKGHMFHTSRWDYNYTGGDPSNPPEQLTKLGDKRIGVIGTGATAVQIVPHLGRWAKELYVFQRTPSSIDVRGNKPTDPEWVKSLGGHWQRERMDNFNILVNGGVVDKDLVSDGWTDIIRKIALSGNVQKETDPATRAQKRQMIDFEKMEQIRHRVDELVTDPETAEGLKPWYNQFCKRPCFHDDYLPTFNRANVHLVDTQGQGIEGITENGIIANGVEHELDCIVFATGFATATGWGRKTGIKVYGRNGLSLSDKWDDGPSTLHGHSTREFPNCFFVSNTQAALSPNFLHITGYQAKHLSYIISRCRDRNVRTVEPTKSAEDEWTEVIIKSRKVRGGSGAVECTPGYYNNEGVKSKALEKSSSYGGGALEFMKLLDEWRAKDDLEGMEMKTWS